MRTLLFWKQMKVLYHLSSCSMAGPLWPVYCSLGQVSLTVSVYTRCGAAPGGDYLRGADKWAEATKSQWYKSSEQAPDHARGHCLELEVQVMGPKLKCEDTRGHLVPFLGCKRSVMLARNTSSPNSNTSPDSHSQDKYSLF